MKTKGKVINELRDRGLTIREIMKKTGLESTSAVAHHLREKRHRFYLTDDDLSNLKSIAKRASEIGFNSEEYKTCIKLGIAK